MLGLEEVIIFLATTKIWEKESSWSWYDSHFKTKSLKNEKSEHQKFEISIYGLKMAYQFLLQKVRACTRDCDFFFSFTTKNVQKEFFTLVGVQFERLSSEVRKKYENPRFEVSIWVDFFSIIAWLRYRK